MVVLCDECHKKRHGITTESAQISNPIQDQESNGKYVKSYSYSTKSKAERASSSKGDIGSNSYTENTGVNVNTRPFSSPKHRSGFKLKYIILTLLLLFILLELKVFLKQETTNDELISTESVEIPPEEILEEMTAQPTEVLSSTPKKKVSGNSSQSNRQKVSKTINNKINSPSEEEVIAGPEIKEDKAESPQAAKDIQEQNERPEEEMSTLELLERRNHADVVKRAQRIGVSTEGTTLEILERINHADVVKRAQRAGVSTEGSTTEIRDRLLRKDLEKNK